MFHNPARIASFDESKLTVAEYTVEQRTLDSYELAPTLIKLHAVGAEYAILKRSATYDPGPQACPYVRIPNDRRDGATL